MQRISRSVDGMVRVDDALCQRSVRVKLGRSLDDNRPIECNASCALDEWMTITTEKGCAMCVRGGWMLDDDDG